MTELKDLKVGDEVTLTIKARVDEKYIEGQDEPYITVDYAKYQDYIIVEQAMIDSSAVTIDRAPRPLPTEPGIYVPAFNASEAAGSFIYRYSSNDDDTDLEWKVDTGERIERGVDGLVTAEYAHEHLGGLVRLVPEQ